MRFLAQKLVFYSCMINMSLCKFLILYSILGWKVCVYAPGIMKTDWVNTLHKGRCNLTHTRGRNHLSNLHWQTVSRLFNPFLSSFFGFVLNYWNCLCFYLWTSNIKVIISHCSLKHNYKSISCTVIQFTTF